jgi:hypothetical protein
MSFLRQNNNNNNNITVREYSMSEDTFFERYLPYINNTSVTSNSSDYLRSNTRRNSNIVYPHYLRRTTTYPMTSTPRSSPIRPTTPTTTNTENRPTNYSELASGFLDDIIFPRRYGLNETTNPTTGTPQPATTTGTPQPATTTGTPQPTSANGLTGTSVSQPRMSYYYRIYNSDGTINSESSSNLDNLQNRTIDNNTDTIVPFIRSFLNVLYPNLSQEITEEEFDNNIISDINVNDIDQEDLRCSICQIEYTDNRNNDSNSDNEDNDVTETSRIDEQNNRVVKLNTCNHNFHYDCIKEWIITNNHTTCPICRTNVINNTTSSTINQTQPNTTG